MEVNGVDLIQRVQEVLLGVERVLDGYCADFHANRSTLAVVPDFDVIL